MLQGAFGNKKIELPYSSNLGEALEAFLDHLMPIRKGHHLHLQENRELRCVMLPLLGQMVNTLLISPEKALSVPVQHSMLKLRQLCRGDWALLQQAVKVSFVAIRGIRTNATSAMKLPLHFCLHWLTGADRHRVSAHPSATDMHLYFTDSTSSQTSGKTLPYPCATKACFEYS